MTGDDRDGRESLDDFETLKPVQPGSFDHNMDTEAPEGVLGLIDRYELREELGAGAFGSVFLARDTEAGIEVAVKGLPPLVQHLPEELERIRANFALVSRLHHPHIASALHLHRAHAVRYATDAVERKLRVFADDYLVVMAYAPGATLSQWRRQFPGGKVPVDRAVEICRQLADALDYAHSRKVVHRDIKPSNVMVETRPDGGLECRLLDFGLAAEIRSSMSRASKDPVPVSGTRPYMAPEQWAGKPQGAATDQYALAVLFHELVSGSVPFASVFDTGDSGIMAHAVEHRTPDPLPELTKPQNRALLCALAKDPGARFRSCRTLVNALQGRRTRESPGGPRPSALPGRKGGPRPPGAVKVLAGLFLLGALAYGAYRSYTYYQAHRERRTLEAAAAAAQDAALDRLAREAEAALAEGDLKTAGERIAALEARGGAGSVASSLKKRLEGAATARRFAEADLAREKLLARGLDRGQGFGSLLDELEVEWRAAESARADRRWGEALTGYDRVLDGIERIEGMETARAEALEGKRKADAARLAASSADADELAGPEWSAATAQAAGAAKAFGSADFAAASKAWTAAAGAFQRAESRAKAVADYRAAQSSFAAALRPHAELLKEHGGDAWSAVQQEARRAQASGNDPAEGARAYRAAQGRLDGAVGEAQEAKARADALAAYNRAVSNAKSLLVQAAETSDRKGARSLLDRALTALAAVDPSLLSSSQRTALATLESQIDHRKSQLPTGPTTGEDWTSPSTGMEFVWIEALNLWVGKYEVTNGEYRKFKPGHDSKEYQGHPLDDDRQPVVYVNFEDAKAYAAWMTERDGRELEGARYRLPSEDEWMTFAQCGDRREYPWGNNWPPQSGQAGNYGDESEFDRARVDGGYTDGHAVSAPVEQSWRNPWGLYGVGGNVWESCAEDRSGASFGAWRGASWSYYLRVYLRCSYRFDCDASYRGFSFGFRFVLSR